MISFLWYENSQKVTKKSQNLLKVLPKTVLFRNTALIFSLEKPCYLENRVVREPCKRRSACIRWLGAVLLWRETFPSLATEALLKRKKNHLYFVTQLPNNSSLITLPGWWKNGKNTSHQWFNFETSSLFEVCEGHNHISKSPKK